MKSVQDALIPFQSSFIIHKPNNAPIIMSIGIKNIAKNIKAIIFFPLKFSKPKIPLSYMLTSFKQGKIRGNAKYTKKNIA